MSLRHSLLGILAQRPASGYDLMKSFNQSLDFVWHATQSQLYTELGRMADLGLIEVTDTGARNRKEYSLTEAGRAELRRWLTETLPDRAIRNEALLRVFFLWTLEPAEAAGYLAGMADWAALRLAALEEVRDGADWSGTAAEVYSRAALDYGIRMTRTTKEWAESTRDLTQAE